MSTLFVGEIDTASRVWMRRQLLGLGKEVSAFVGWGRRIAGCGHMDWIDLDSVKPCLVVRALNRIRALNYDPWEQALLKTVKIAMASRWVSNSLVHFLTTAVRFRDVWRTVDKPVYVHCHGYDVTWDKRQHDPPFARVHSEHYVRQVKELPKTVRFIANSMYTLQRLQEIGIDPCRVHIKPLGVPVSMFCVNRRPSGTHVKILYLGRLIDAKGPDLVIRAFDLACRQGLRATLTVAGDGPLRTTCELERRRSTFADRIRLVGEVTESQAAILRRKSDIFTAHNCTGPITDQQEAYGVSLVEAMADGLVVVTGASGGPTEFIEHGKNGFLVEPGNIADHADAFKRLADDMELRARIGGAALRTVQQYYSIEQEIDELRKILSGHGQLSARCHVPPATPSRTKRRNRPARIGVRHDHEF